MIDKPDFWPSMKSGDYQHAVEVLTSESDQWSSADWRRAGTLGRALMALGQFTRATGAFLLAQGLALEDREHQVGYFSDWLGASYWLSGHRQEGAEHWCKFVVGVESKSISYTDFSGGIDIGLMLLYAGVTLDDPRLTRQASDFFKYAKNRPFSRMMPGPLLHYVRGDIPIEVLIVERFSAPDLQTCMSKAVNDIRFRREMCQVLLCMATVARISRDVSQATTYFCMAASLVNPLVQVEWYLAQAECCAASSPNLHLL